MYAVYVQYTSPIRGAQKPVLFDTAKTPKKATVLVGLAKGRFQQDCKAFIGRNCEVCHTPFPTNGLTGNVCFECNHNLLEQNGKT